MKLGIDYTNSSLKGSVIKEHGYSFVGRYLSYSPWKTITKREYDDLKENDLGVILVWETTEQRTMSGYTGGVEDAKAAADLADQIGFPNDKPIYFAVDYEFNPEQLKTVSRYFEGVGSVISTKLVGVYGGLQTVKTILDDYLATYAWQTLAWSHGEWDPRAQVQQFNTGTNMVNGMACDLNRAIVDDYGQG